MLLEFWVGLTKQENGIIALPSGWLSAGTVQLVFMHIGHSSKSVSNGKSNAAWAASRSVVFAVYTGVFGVMFYLIAAFLIIGSARLVWGSAPTV